MEIITKGYPDDGKVKLDSAILVYYQGPDCTEQEDEYQEITISTRNNGTDNFIHIKTNGWSIDNTDSLVAVVEDFKKRINYE